MTTQSAEPKPELSARILIALKDITLLLTGLPFIVLGAVLNFAWNYFMTGWSFVDFHFGEYLKSKADH